MATQQQLVSNDGKIYEIRNDVPFARVLRQVVIPSWGHHSMVTLTIPKIPYQLFRQITAWQRKIAKAHKCESTTSLFLVDGVWVAVPFYQSNDTNSMTADVDFKTDANAELLARYADTSAVHATLHNHVMAGAGQSGRDSADEKNLAGPHITIGNLDRKNLSFHARLSTMIDGKHEFILLRPSEIIDIPLPPGPIKADTLKDLEEAYLTFDSEDSEIPEEWEDRFTLKEKKIYTPSVYQGGANQTASTSGPTSSGKTLEDFVEANRENLTPWPYGFLTEVRTDTKENFKKDMEQLSIIQMHSALAVVSFLGENADYNDLREHLIQRRSPVQAS